MKHCKSSTTHFLTSEMRHAHESVFERDNGFTILLIDGLRCSRLLTLQSKIQR